MKRAAIYCRVSTENQEREGTSLDTQMSACLKFAKDNGYEVSPEFTFKEARSGLSLGRPLLGKLRDAAKNKRIDTVIAYCLDRLSRDPVDFIVLQDELKKVGVNILFVTETNDSSDLGILISHIRGYAAKLEPAKTRERTMRAKNDLAKIGVVPQAFGRYGGYFGTTYSRREQGGSGRFEHNPQIVIAHEILRRYMSGESRNSITRDLQARGIRGAAGGLIHASAVARVLHNARIYSGVITWNGFEIRDKIEPIITEEDVLAIEKRLKQNKEKSYGFGKRKWLTSRVFCGTCGRRYALDTRKGCYCNANTSVSPVKCHSPKVGLRELNALAYGAMMTALSEPEVVVEKAKIAHDGWEQEKKEFDKLLAMRQQSEHQKEMRRRALSVQHEMGGITDEEYRRRLDQIRRETEHEIDVDQIALFEKEPPTPEQIKQTYNRLKAYKPLRLHFEEVLKNPQDKLAGELADSLGLKVVIKQPKRPNHKFSAKVLLNLPIREEEMSFPDEDDPIAMVFKTSGYCVFLPPLSPELSWHALDP